MQTLRDKRIKSRFVIQVRTVDIHGKPIKTTAFTVESKKITTSKKLAEELKEYCVNMVD